MTHPYLATLGMCFNTFLGLVICLDCGAAIGGQSIETHLHVIHKEESFRIDHIKLKQTLVDLQVKESFDLTNLPPNCHQIEGLHLSSDAYLCSICQHIRGTLLSIKRHHLTTHSTSPMPISWTRVVAQQLHHHNHSSYFQVIPKDTPSDNNDITTQFFISLNKNRQKAVADYDISKIDPRQVSVWLKITKWHVLVAPYDHNHLLSLVKMPIKSETMLEILAKAVDSYTLKADRAIDTLSNLALRILNSPEPL